MPKTINPAIGTCPCPVCGDSSAVKRFNVRALSATRARRGGRLYVECKRHGTFTSAAAEMQDWILERATIWGPEGQPVSVAAILSAPVPEVGAFETPDNPNRIPQKRDTVDYSSEKATPAARNGWGFFT